MLIEEPPNLGQPPRWNEARFQPTMGVANHGQRDKMPTGPWKGSRSPIALMMPARAFWPVKLEHAHVLELKVSGRGKIRESSGPRAVR